jgi:hypothetical protein
VIGPEKKPSVNAFRSGFHGGCMVCLRGKESNREDASPVSLGNKKGRGVIPVRMRCLTTPVKRQPSI